MHSCCIFDASFDKSAPNLQHICNKSATKLQQNCNKTATKLQQIMPCLARPGLALLLLLVQRLMLEPGKVDASYCNRKSVMQLVQHGPHAECHPSPSSSPPPLTPHIRRGGGRGAEGRPSVVHGVVDPVFLLAEDCPSTCRGPAAAADYVSQDIGPPSAART